MSDKLISHLNNNQLIDAGTAKALAESSQQTLRILNHAKQIDNKYNGLSAVDRERLRNRYKVKK